MKSKLFLLIAVCGMMLVSCQDNTPECYYHKKVIDLAVQPEAWKFDSTALQFYARFKMPEITSYVYNYGQWAVYCEVERSKDEKFQAVLPVSRFYTDTAREEMINYYTQYIDYRISVGYVDIQLTNSDHLYGQEKPEGMDFRLQANDVILDLRVNQADWNFDDQTGQYYCHIAVPDITEEIYNNGHFTVCREFEKGKTSAYQVPLPTSTFLSEVVPVNTPYYYSQALDYVVGLGYLDIQLTNSDYYYDSTGKPVLPETIYFRMVLTY
ncbi:MAG: hypothetical protein IKP11_01915 [Paludibacteraceae bacterium]|nr:hypothetical protein [Paludibacteraceae bacterium]